MTYYLRQVESESFDSATRVYLSCLRSSMESKRLERHRVLAISLHATTGVSPPKTTIPKSPGTSCQLWTRSLLKIQDLLHWMATKFEHSREMDRIIAAEWGRYPARTPSITCTSTRSSWGSAYVTNGSKLERVWQHVKPHCSPRRKVREGRRQPTSPSLDLCRHRSRANHGPQVNNEPW